MLLTRFSAPQKVKEVVNRNKRSQKICRKVVLEHLLCYILRRFFELVSPIAYLAHNPAVFDRIVQNDHDLNGFAVNGHLNQAAKNVSNGDASYPVKKGCISCWGRIVSGERGLHILWCGHENYVCQFYSRMVDIPMDLWDQIHNRCTPWGRFSLSLLNSVFRDRYEPLHVRHDRLICTTIERPFEDEYYPQSHFGENTKDGTGYVSGGAITITRIRGYTCEFCCVNGKGMDDILVERLRLIDSFWAEKLPRKLKYKSFIGNDPTGLTVRAEFDRARYYLEFRPYGHDTRECETSKERRESDVGTLVTEEGDESLLSTRCREGYERVVLRLYPVIEGENFRLKVKIEACRNLVNDT